jgi:hypothetical protein
VSRLALAVLAAAVIASPSYADDAAPPQPTPFDRGKIGVSVGGGSSSVFGHTYYSLGGGIGYFVLDGVELGLSGLAQFGADPSIEKLSPSLRYVVKPLVGKWPVIPYVGGFYTHWFVGDPIPDVDTVGGRVGGLFISGQVVLGLGVAYERIISTCTMDCDLVYPDLTISLAF